jgi:EmrB/QacA subfamily drug resistance transporter
VATTDISTTAGSGDGGVTSASGLPQRQLHILLATLIASTCLASMDTSILVTALPTIAGQFNAFEQLSWVISAYIVTSTISTPLLGKLSDLYGRRTIFLGAMGTFALASLLCGLSQSMGQLIAARAVQGVGGGAIQALSFAILGDILPPRERGRYVGYFTLAFASAALLGPVVGGFIIDHWTWPWIFFINLPLCALLMMALRRTLSLPFRRRRAKLDLTGAALIAVGLAALMIGLEEAKTTVFNSKSLLLVGIFLVVLPIFVWQENRAVEPMIPMGLFRNRVVLACSMLGVCAGAVSFGASNYMSVYFQDALFISPTQAGLRSMPLMFGIVVGSTGTGRLIAARGYYKRFPIGGSILAVAGLSVLSVLIFHRSAYVQFIPWMVVMGLGFGAVYTTTSIATQNACEIRDMGVATATIMFFRSLGGSVMLAISGTILNKTVRAELPRRVGISAEKGIALLREPKQIAGLPVAVRNAVVDSISTGVGRIQVAAALSMVIAIVWALVLPELPLRDRAGLTDLLQTE